MVSSTESIKLPRNWVLWYHRKDDSNWSISSYKKIASIQTSDDFWRVMNSIGTVINEMFFLMVEGVDPTYEATRHRNGGAWLYKIHKSVTDNVWYRLCELLVTETICSHSNRITGISVSPKYSYAIIRIWNDDISLRTRAGFSFTDYAVENIDFNSRFIYQAHDLKNNSLKKHHYLHPSIKEN